MYFVRMCGNNIFRRTGLPPIWSARLYTKHNCYSTGLQNIFNTKHANVFIYATNKITTKLKFM